MFTLPDLPYTYDALGSSIDEQTMHLHHDKHHAAYVKNLNDVLIGHDDLLAMDIDELIANLSKVPETIRTKVRNHGGGHANHSLFWKIMKPHTGGQPTGKLASTLDDVFGNFKTFQDKFSQAAMGRFGSGWAWLVVDGGELTITDTPNQDSPLMDGKTPILGLDVWEHAYYLKYQNRRADYISAWWQVVDWEEVAKRFSSLGET